MKPTYIILLILLSQGNSFGQSNYRLIQKGNSALEREQYSESEILYRKALEQNGKLTTANYNIGNARYMQGDFEGAASKFGQSAETFEKKEDKAHAYHNQGNSLLSQKKYEASIEAYKNSLKLNPSDMDTKYNLAFAQKMLRKEQEQQQQDQEKKEDNKENEDQEEKNKESEDKGDQESKKEEDQSGDEKEEQNKEGDKENKNTENKDPKDGKLTKEQAEQILKMLEGEESKLQEKLDEPEGEAVKIKIEKDW